MSIEERLSRVLAEEAEQIDVDVAELRHRTRERLAAVPGRTDRKGGTGGGAGTRDPRRPQPRWRCWSAGGVLGSQLVRRRPGRRRAGPAR